MIDTETLPRVGDDQHNLFELEVSPHETKRQHFNL